MTVRPAGVETCDRVTLPTKPPSALAVIVVVPVPPSPAKLTVIGLAETLKSGTFTMNVVVTVITVGATPLVPVTVTV